MQFDILSMMASADKTPFFSTEYLMIISAVCMVVLVIGSITDFRKREVLDYLSYFLIFAALGIRFLYSVWTSDYMIILSGIIGFLIFFLMSVALYYTGQWGGGDSKVLMGLGAAIGFYIPRTMIFSQDMLLDFMHHGVMRFVLFILLFGALYTVIWSVVLAAINFKKVAAEFRKLFCFLGPFRIIQDFFSGSLKRYPRESKKEFVLGESNISDKGSKDEIERYNGMTFARMLIYLFLFVLGILFLLSDAFSKNVILFIMVTSVLLYLLVLILKSIESVSMVLTVGIDKISEGEWISQDYFIRKKRVESLGEFLERKIRGNAILTIPFTLKSKKDFDVKVSDEVKEQYSESIREVEKMIFTYSHSRLRSMFRSVYFVFFRRSNSYARYAESIALLLDAKDQNEFIRINSRLKKYNGQFCYETLFDLFNFRYDLEYVGGPSQLGIDLEGIDLLRKNGVKQVQIRQGIPFVPSFLLSFIFFIIL